MICPCCNKEITPEDYRIRDERLRKAKLYKEFCNQPSTKRLNKMMNLPAVLMISGATIAILVSNLHWLFIGGGFLVAMSGLVRLIALINKEERMYKQFETDRWLDFRAI